MRNRTEEFDDVKAAREAAYNVGPRVYQLKGIKDEPLRFITVGCHGAKGKTPQKITARLMNEVSRELKRYGKQAPAFILFLGDNIYDNGVTSPHSALFDKCFENVYKDVELAHINGIPCFFALGNHDHKYHAHANVENTGRKLLNMNLVEQGEQLALNQVARTYYANHEEGINRRVEQFTKPELEASELTGWNMPYFFYSLVAGNTQIFVLDSNTYLHDFLDLMNPDVTINDAGINLETGKINQAFWFQQENHKAQLEGRQIFIAQHHPLFVSGKRSFPNKYDSGHYLSGEQIKDINAALAELNEKHEYTESLNELLRLAYEAQGTQHHLLFAAHEHFISWHNDAEKPNNPNPVRQFTSGGGGGELHPRCSFRAHPYVGMHQQHNGFGIVTTQSKQSKDYVVDIHTVDGLHLQFNQDSHRPIYNKNSDPQVESLREIVLEACDRYFSYLRQNEIRQHNAASADDNEDGSIYSMFKKTSTQIMHAVTNLKHHFMPDEDRLNEVKTVQDIMAFFSQADLPNFQRSVERLFYLTAQLPFLHSNEPQEFYGQLENTYYHKTDGHRLKSLFEAGGLHAPLPDNVESMQYQRGY